MGTDLMDWVGTDLTGGVDNKKTLPLVRCYANDEGAGRWLGLVDCCERVGRGLWRKA